MIPKIYRYNYISIYKKKLYVFGKYENIHSKDIYSLKKLYQTLYIMFGLVF